MKTYLNKQYNFNDADFISVVDELPLWSAPFGLSLLDTIKIKKGMKVLDLGCGLGFPMLEIANRLGESSKVIGIDPWEKAIERVKAKIKTCNITNAEIIKGVGENLPFEDYSFDLVVSNNGINNVEDIEKTIAECFRVCKPYSQFVFTMNTEDSMFEFYKVFKKVLKKNEMSEEVDAMKKHIYEKRRPLKEIKKFLDKSGFEINKIKKDSFTLRFADGTALLNHFLINVAFLFSWKQLVKADKLELIFDQIEERLNKKADEDGELVLTIPFVTFDCRKSEDLS